MAHRRPYIASFGLIALVLASSPAVQARDVAPLAPGARNPILPGYFDYPRKVIGLGPLFHPTDDKDADLAALRAFYKPFRGKHRGV